jgi:hypothetical protein
MRCALAAALALLALAATGCGGSGDPEPEGGTGFYGVAPQELVGDADLARMQRGNLGSYHLLLSWGQIAVEDGAYKYSALDTQMTGLALHGLHPVAYVYGTPDWLAKTENTPPTTPEELAAFRAFLTAMAARYGPGGEFWDAFERAHPDVPPQPIDVWEIWNEVNGPAFWLPEPDPSQYARLLRVSERTLHEVDPAAQIMVAGMFATPSSEGAINSFEYLHKLFSKPGVTDAIDLVGVHPYGPNLSAVREQMEGTREAMEEGGVGDLGTWVTEVGWGSDKNVESQLTKTPDKQAALLTKTYEMMLENREDWNLRGVLWYTWRDAADPTGLCAWCPSAGLVDDDLDAKPAWDAYTDLTGGDPG